MTSPDSAATHPAPTANRAPGPSSLHMPTSGTRTTVAVKEAAVGQMGSAPNFLESQKTRAPAAAAPSQALPGRRWRGLHAASRPVGFTRPTYQRLIQRA